MSTMQADWPKAGPIDLALHDLPHASSTTEWWYFNGILSYKRKSYRRYTNNYHPNYSSSSIFL